jgi:hypothetical protein
MEQYNFEGWATKNNIKCSDGRVIMKDAFKHCDGLVVPLVWGHNHDDPARVLGHALLENRDEGVYTYGSFNSTEQGQMAKELVEHGDIFALSIYANQLRQAGSNVQHGMIREVSLVHAGANPGAYIENVIRHSDDGSSVVSDDEIVIYTGEKFELCHSDKGGSEDKKEDTPMAEEAKKTGGEKTVADVFNEFTEEQKTVVYAMIGQALEDAGVSDDDDEDVQHSDEGGVTMGYNIFENDTQRGAVLSHADQVEIIAAAKTSGVGSLQDAIKMFKEDKALAHTNFVNEEDEDAIETLFPDFHDTNTGAPHTLKNDQSWVMSVINKIHKSPYSRIRTRHADARIADLRAKGYQKKGDEKKISGTIKLLSRTTDPQTVYRKDMLNRDDIVDITDFDVVAYQWGIMKENMYEELALAALVGDGREDGDPDKIHETHIRSIWNDEELYTIHKDVDFAKAKADLQGSNTSANFGENYIYAEAIITAALYSREKFKGSGTPDLYCTPHLINVMLLARDLNGRRIYDSKADLARALNVGTIHEIEQLEDKVRTTATGAKKKLLGLFVNLADYQFGSTKGGEITKFDDFDIDFNQYKYLIETRLSGALTRPYAAIALEEPVAEEAAG